MPDRLETVLREGAEQFAGAVHPLAADIVRARGDRRRVRAAALSATVVAVALAGAVFAGLSLHAARHGGAVVSPGRSLHLRAPSVYIAGVPNPATFTIPGQGRPSTVTVSLDFGQPRYAVYSEPAVLHRDQATGQWLAVALTSRHGDWTGTYVVRVPATGIGQRLLIVPALAREAPPWGAGRLTVRLVAAGRVLGSQRGPNTVLSGPGGDLGSFRRSAIPISVPRGDSRPVTFTVRNPVDFGFRLSFTVFAFLCPRSKCPSRPAGIGVRWLHDGRWHELGAAAWAGNGQLLGTELLRPGATVTIRFLVTAMGTAPPVTGMLSMQVEPDRSSFPGVIRYRQYISTSHSGIILIG